MSSAVESLFARLAVYGPRTALSENGRELTYDGLLAAVVSRSRHLRDLGAQRVALALDNGIDWVLWDLAALHAGLVCVPVPGFFSADQQRHVLDSAGIDCLIGAGAPGFASVEGDIHRRTLAQAPALHAGTCKITYTSGTTGQPKGVCLDLATQLAVADSLVKASASRKVERHLCILPLATLLENIAGIYAPLLAGACVELMPMAQIGLTGASGFDLMRFLQALQASQPHSLILLPQLLLALVSAAERKLPVPSSLRFVAVGGGRVSAQLLHRADAMGLPIFEGYGLSECASVVCLNTPEQRHIGSTGKPLEHLQIRLTDDGEVLVKGARMLGYIGEAAVQDEWLRTCDLGHFEDGFLVLHGRKKHQFITAFGRNVNPEWVESELVQQLPIAQAWLHGEALPSNVAVLVPRFANTPDAQLQATVDEVNHGLPDYARVHHWLRADAPFNASNDLATANGRLRRSALFNHYQTAIEALMAEGVHA
ncbi:putative Long-chain-fatty-acid--CoA ligase [Pseudomonas sp. 8Z]|uniref:AMP-binding protein n=1 Tax=Pseudomonas sp. 8Z TaxID=2653166 RepID=UPI0012F11D2B|nr:AMP-binding protein [Pseudomonas sp. 8Z]VXC74895.1 putative Long-chain-fatty-acid--CoA ligase [Pseudomonas sp. 8Z]